MTDLEGLNTQTMGLKSTGRASAPSASYQGQSEIHVSQFYPE